MILSATMSSPAIKPPSLPREPGERGAANTTAGIRPANVFGFLIAQIVGATAAIAIFGWLVPVHHLSVTPTISFLKNPAFRRWACVCSVHRNCMGCRRRHIRPTGFLRAGTWPPPTTPWSGRWELQRLAPIVGIDGYAIGDHKITWDAYIVLFAPFLRFYRGVVIDQPVPLDHMDSVALRRA